jgi:hypothetical protein
MRISLTRTGGLAGMRRTATVDTAALDPSRAEALERLFRQAELEGPSSAPARSRPAPDRFRYTLTVEEAGQQRTVQFGEEGAPDSVQRFVEAVWREAEPEPPDLRRA